MENCIFFDVFFHFSFFDRLAHHLSINKIEFKSDESKIMLASCGNDSLVRVYTIEIEK